MSEAMTATGPNGERFAGHGDCCPACGSNTLRSFYKKSGIPVNSCILMSTPEEAIGYPKGDIDMNFCENCGFIYNRAFNENNIQYSEKYEETQGFSGTFNKFHKKLAEDIIQKHGLREKDVIEIGCGKGEFIAMLAQMGDNRGVGFDPAYVADRSLAAKTDNVEYVVDFYSEKYADRDADFICCKMTLEHIPEVQRFISTVRSAAGQRTETAVFFQIPEVTLILEERGFWDVYYEHCSYFTKGLKGSLATLFRRCGFDVKDVWVDYGDQYLMIEAYPAEGAQADPEGVAEEVAALGKLVDDFSRDVTVNIANWKASMGEWARDGKKVVLWGSGSKAVSFLTSVGITDELSYVVDINPNRHGYFMPGTGHEIVSPDFLADYKPDVVVIMNPIYRDEITQSCKERGLDPEIRTVLEPLGKGAAPTA